MALLNPNNKSRPRPPDGHGGRPARRLVVAAALATLGAVLVVGARLAEEAVHDYLERQWTEAERVVAELEAMEDPETAEAAERHHARLLEITERLESASPLLPLLPVVAVVTAHWSGWVLAAVALLLAAVEFISRAIRWGR